MGVQGSSGPNSTSGSSEGASHGRRGRTPSVKAEDFSLDAAMGLYGLEHMEVLLHSLHAQSYVEKSPTIKCGSVAAHM